MHHLRAALHRYVVVIVVVAAACFAQEVRVVGPAGSGEPDPPAGGGGITRTLSITPQNATLAIGSNLLFTLTLIENGVLTPVGTVTWTSSNNAVATIDASGRLQARVAGSAVITASASGAAATAAVTVVPTAVGSVALTPQTATLQLGSAAQFTAVVRDAGGNPLTGRFVAWATSNAAVLTVDASGLARAVGVGTATLTGTSEGRSGTASVTVQNVPVVTVQVAPGQDTVQLGAQILLVATPRDSIGGALTGRAIAWSSSAQSVARVSGNGLVDGIAVGTATITATSEGRSGSAVVTVIPVPVAAVVVVPQSVTVIMGATTTFNATPRDANGVALTGRAVSWVSANPSIAQVSPTGVVSGLSTGSALISATIEGVVGSAFVTVTAAAATLVSVTIAPETVSLMAAQTQLFTMTGRLSDNSTVPVSGTYTTNGGAVNGSGLYTAPDASGTFRVIGTATGTSLRDTATVTVTRQPVATVQVTPASATVDVGRTLTLTAATRDAGGNLLTNRVITWSSSSTAVATVNSSGVVTAQAAGNATITATSEGQTGTSSITTRFTPVATVQVSPNAATIEVGLTSTLTATARDSSGSVLTGRTITWASSNPAVATVTSSGVVTGVAIGNAVVTATSGAAVGTAAITVVFVPVATVDVQPGTATVGIGQTQPFTAVLRDATNRVLTGRPVTWSSSNAAVASVNASGVAQGVALGTAYVIAVSEGRRDSSQVTVVSASAQPMLLEDFSTYTSTANMLADPRGIYRLAEDFLPAQIALDETVGFGSSTKSMRYTYPDRSSSGSRCSDYTISRWIDMNTLSRAWVEIYVKFSSNFSVSAPGSWGCSSGQELKLIFAIPSGGSSRWNVEMQPTRWIWGWPGSEAAVIVESHDPDIFFDNQWHRIRMEIGSGVARLWLDNQLVSNVTNASSSSVGGIILARNINQGPGQVQHLWWGRVAIYDRNPGW